MNCVYFMENLTRTFFRMERSWNDLFAKVLKLQRKTRERASVRVNAHLYSTKAEKSEGDPEGVRWHFHSDAGQDCVRYRSAIGYSVLPPSSIIVTATFCHSLFFSY